jgi:arylsulfatase A-like enzyme
MNVFMILEDALRPDHLGCYGYRKDTSPSVDRLAREGVRFETCIAVASHTFPPIVSLLMGQETATHGLVNASRYGRWTQSPSWRDRETPLKILERRGMQVDGELVLRWKPLGFRRDTEGKDIERYFESHRNEPWFFLAEPYPTHLPYNPPEPYYRLFLEPGFTTGPDTEERIQIVRSRLIVHPPGLVSKLEAGEDETLPDDLTDTTHKRTVGTAEFDPQSDGPAVRALYDGEVRVFDDLVGRWIQALEALRMLDDTLVVVVADHGEELLERGHVGHSSCNLRGTLYDESIRIPLIMRYPQRLPEGTVVKRQVSQVDVMPTILDLLGIPRPEFVDGSSLLPLVEGTQMGPRRPHRRGGRLCGTTGGRSGASAPTDGSSSRTRKAPATSTGSSSTTSRGTRRSGPTSTDPAIPLRSSWSLRFWPTSAGPGTSRCSPVTFGGNASGQRDDFTGESPTSSALPEYRSPGAGPRFHARDRRDGLGVPGPPAVSLAASLSTPGVRLEPVSGRGGR